MSRTQIGEFSFILAGLGVALNSLLFGAIEPSQRWLRWLRQRSAFARRLERSDDPLAELPQTMDPGLLTGHVLARMGRAAAAH